MEILDHIEEQSEQLRQINTANKTIAETLSKLSRTTAAIITLLQNTVDTHEWQEEISANVLKAIIALLYQSNIHISVCGCATVLKGASSRRSMAQSLSQLSTPITALHITHQLLLHTLSFLSRELAPPEPAEDEKSRRFQSRASLRMSREFPKDEHETPTQPVNNSALATSADRSEQLKRKLEEEANAAGLQVIFGVCVCASGGVCEKSWLSFFFPHFS